MKGTPDGVAGGVARAFLRDVVTVARQELDDAVRTRRAAVVLLIYFAGAMLAFNGIISGVHRGERQLSEALGLRAASSPGAVTAALWKSHLFRGLVESLVGDAGAARDLLSIPPMALIYAALVTLFIGPLIMLTSAGRIAEEVNAGSARLALLRTTRPAWCIGKFVGQGLLLFAALALSVVGAWCVARFRLANMDGPATGGAMLVIAAKAWLYGLAMTGLALGVSQTTRSPGVATALSLLAWMATAVVYRVAQHFAGDGWRRVWELVILLTPQSHSLDLFRLDLTHVIPAALFLATLAVVYLLAGYARFARRDL